MTMKDSSLVVESRDGSLNPFDVGKIRNAINKAAISSGIAQSQLENTLNGVVDRISEDVRNRFFDSDFVPNVENIHDIVQVHLMKDGHFQVAEAYILYRDKKRREQAEKHKKVSFLRKLKVEKRDGRIVAFAPQKLKENIARISDGLKFVDEDLLFIETAKSVFDGIKSEEIDKAIVLAATGLVERDPEYDTVACRAFLQMLKKEVLGLSSESETKEATDLYRGFLKQSIQKGVDAGILCKGMLSYDFDKLVKAIEPERDNLLRYMSLSTLYQRYFVQVNERRIELPQIFFMRVAMGLALNEDNREQAAIDFYNVFSNLEYMPSTPTLFHSGFVRAQLSSCYLTTCDDDLRMIFKQYGDNAQMSKFSGGIGNDWTNIRATNAMVKTTNVESQGVIPFLKIANDTTVAINRSGKRRGAVCAYLEYWHRDIEAFIDLRKNTGDERRRTHDMNTAIWMPDLFMQRLQEGGDWTLFSPDETPDLHDSYGSKFKELYEGYEAKAAKGEIRLFKTVKATELWRKTLGMIFETGHPWITFKDPSNIRSPQDHDGVVHSSNLCTEVILNTKPSKLQRDGSIDLGETAVCNIGSMVLPRFVTNAAIDWDKLASRVAMAIRILDDVIDLCFYPTPEGENANKKHRPIGLGIMGWQDMLYELGIPFENAGDLADELMEFISYHAIKTSMELAKERGSYSTFEGSKWDRGIFPCDTLEALEKERGSHLTVVKNYKKQWGSPELDWASLKQQVNKHGMRNSTTMCIAPTATISTITGCVGACIEAVYSNLFVESNMSGEFTVVNRYLVEDLKKEDLWNKDMLDMLKYHDGSVQQLDVPDWIKAKYKGVFEVNPFTCLEMTARRGKWIDQSQSHNIFMKGKSGKTLSELYQFAWNSGLKTTYYLRTLGASAMEKNTLDIKKYGMTQIRTPEPAKACSINNPDCESCQ